MFGMYATSCGPVVMVVVCYMFGNESLGSNSIPNTYRSNIPPASFFCIDHSVSDSISDALFNGQLAILGYPCENGVYCKLTKSGVKKCGIYF